MSGRRGGGGGRGGDVQRDQSQGGRGGGGRGARGGGAGRGRGGGREGSRPPSHQRDQAGPSTPAMAGLQPAAPPTRQQRPDLPMSSSSAAASPASSLTQEVDRLSIRDRDPSTGTRSDEEKLAVVTASPESEEAAPPPPSSSKAMRHPPRPGFGTVGMKCVVRANHFLVGILQKDLHHYDVAITPEVTSRNVCRSIINQLVELYRASHLGNLKPAYDGRKSLYTAGELPFVSKKFRITLTDREREKQYDVTIKHAGQADLHYLQQFLQGRQFDTPQETIQVLDVVLREFPSNKYVCVSRSFFSPLFGDRTEIGNGVECWRGYYQSLRPTQMGLSLNIDISATSFYRPVRVVDFVAEYLNLRSENDMFRPLRDQDRVKIRKALRGIRVEITHRGDVRRRYKITGISPMPLSQLTFSAGDEGVLTHVTEYFREKYHLQLKHVAWPCLQTGSDSRPTYLPMEVCKIVEGQRYSKKLNEQQVTQILRTTCQRPPQRERSIMEMVKRNDYKNDELANEFGMTVSPQLTAVEARVLQPPTLKYHDTGKDKTCNPRLGAWNMIGKKMAEGGRVNSWACISFSRNTRPDAVYYFCESLIGLCNNIGMSINPESVVDIWFERSYSEASLRKLCNEAAAQLQQRKQDPLQLLLVVLPELSGSYGNIKRVCETELGVVSQCFLPKHVSQAKPQYMENVALKINVKVGGRNSVLQDALHKRIPFVTDKPTIIFGADVTHPAPGEDSSASIAAVVASMDWPEVTKYKGLVSAQSHREEMIKDLFTVTQDPKKGPVFGGMIRELLISFYKLRKQKPHRILFYRDGVSEGQFSQVLLYEMDAIRKACASLEEGYLPPVTFVVVQKRHHTRLFPDYNGQMDKSGNILPGTVVDKKICHPSEFDFYLCSHAGIQGTSRPTHYHVLWDENGFSADALQTLTNNLCYTYARCTRSVSVVPPAYYAHLAAFRARYYVEGDSDAGTSSVGAGGTRERGREVRPLPRVRENVKEVMFYC